MIKTNHLMVILFFIAVAPATAVEVGAYYYPWYGSFPGGHSFTDTLRHHLVPPQASAIGSYSDRNSTAVATHIDQSHRGNIDFWALSWWGPQSTEDFTIRSASWNAAALASLAASVASVARLCSASS
jgi:hypothetical protein